MAPAQLEHPVDGAALLLWAVAREVQVQTPRPHLRGLRGDEAQPDLRGIARDQHGAGLGADLAAQQRGPERRDRRGIGDFERHGLETDPHLVTAVPRISRPAVPGRYRCAAWLIRIPSITAARSFSDIAKPEGRLRYPGYMLDGVDVRTPGMKRIRTSVLVVSPSVLR